jgi:hypothetical protein
VGRLLHEAGYSLQANSKTLEGSRLLTAKLDEDEDDRLGEHASG